MIVVHALSRSKPAHRAEVAAAMLELQRATLAADDGCLHYRFVAELDDDCRFTCVEEWRDIDALRAHLAAPHIATYRSAVDGLMDGDTELRVFEAEQRAAP